MKPGNKPRFALAILVAFVLPACSAPGLKSGQENANTDLFELERQADAAYQQGDLAASEQDYVELVKKIPEESLHWFRLGNIYARTQRPDAAIIAYREAVLRKPDSSKAWYNMGIIQLREAANTFNEMQVHTESQDPLHNEGKRIMEEILNIIKNKNSAADSRPGEDKSGQ